MDPAAYARARARRRSLGWRGSGSGRRAAGRAPRRWPGSACRAGSAKLEVELGDHPPESLKLSRLADPLPGYGDLLVAVLVEEPGRAVIPLIRSPDAFMPDGELIVECVAQDDFATA